MKNPIIIFVVVVAFVILGIGAYTLSQKSSQFGSMMKKDDNTMEDNKMMDDKMNDSRYVQYDKSAFDNASRNRRILFFYASWCPTCKPADVDLKANSKKMPDDLTVIRVNYNDPETDQEEKDLAKKYGITYQHTFVQIDSKGNEITKWNGGKTDELLAKIK
jgi:thiol-disulfide isomerase/thioredoxin